MQWLPKPTSGGNSAIMITIGIPAFGQADTLGESIQSALNQTVPCEIIVVIDGSPDNSEEVAKSFPMKVYSVKVIVQKNKGLASARNTAIMGMDGDYFLPLDSDDILLPHCAETLLKKARETDADIIAPSIRCFGLANQDIIIKDTVILQDFKEGNRIPYCSMIKKEALLEVGGYSPRMEKGWEDLHLWYDLLTRGKKIATIQEPLVLYRTKQESMWTQARDKHGAELQAQIDKDFPNLFV